MKRARPPEMVRTVPGSLIDAILKEWGRENGSGDIWRRATAAQIRRASSTLPFHGSPRCRADPTRTRQSSLRVLRLDERPIVVLPQEPRLRRTEGCVQIIRKASTFAWLLFTSCSPSMSEREQPTPRLSTNCATALPKPFWADNKLVQLARILFRSVSSLHFAKKPSPPH